LDQATIIAAVAVIISGLGMIWTYYGGIIKIRNETATALNEIRKEITTQGNRLVRLETKADIFWSNISTSMSSMIKQPIHYRKDELMDKLTLGQENRTYILTVEELLELKIILKEEASSLQEMKEPKSLAYALALAYIDQLLYDKGLLKGDCL
jgi:hypothetical protein